jgi:gluconate 5-dehydrogenase
VNPDFMTEPIGFWQVSPDGFRDLLATNVLGYFLVARAVVPHMLEAGHGKIVNISVSETTMRRRGFTPYGPSRAATEALSHIMAADLAGTGIDVNLLLPGGATRSGMTPDSAPEDLQATWLDPAIMGPPVVWLASPASDGLTDQRIVASEFTARLFMLSPGRKPGDTPAHQPRRPAHSLHLHPRRRRDRNQDGVHRRPGTRGRPRQPGRPR